jgi:hypothetical protein
VSRIATTRSAPKLLSPFGGPPCRPTERPLRHISPLAASIAGVEAFEAANLHVNTIGPIDEPDV